MTSQDELEKLADKLREQHENMTDEKLSDKEKKENVKAYFMKKLKSTTEGEYKVASVHAKANDVYVKSQQEILKNWNHWRIGKKPNSWKNSCSIRNGAFAYHANIDMFFAGSSWRTKVGEANIELTKPSPSKQLFCDIRMNHLIDPTPIHTEKNSIQRTLQMANEDRQYIDDHTYVRTPANQQQSLFNIDESPIEIGDEAPPPVYISTITETEESLLTTLSNCITVDEATNTSDNTNDFCGSLQVMITRAYEAIEKHREHLELLEATQQTAKAIADRLVKKSQTKRTRSEKLEALLMRVSSPSKAPKVNQDEHSDSGHDCSQSTD